jgi:hypothetical protein
METKQMIVAICLMVAVLLAEAGGGIYDTSNTSRGSFIYHKKFKVPEAKDGVDQKADPDASLTTVRKFRFIMVTKDEIVAVQLHAFQN